MMAVPKELDPPMPSDPHLTVKVMVVVHLRETDHLVVTHLGLLLGIG